MGMEYTGTPVGPANNTITVPQTCQELCKKSATCMDFTWDGDATCTLWKEQTGSSAKDEYISGPKDCRK